MSDGFLDALMFMNSDDEETEVNTRFEELFSQEEWDELNKSVSDYTPPPRKKCTCGSAKTYGENIPRQMHSDWCDIG